MGQRMDCESCAPLALAFFCFGSALICRFFPTAFDFYTRRLRGKEDSSWTLRVSMPLRRGLFFFWPQACDPGPFLPRADVFEEIVPCHLVPFFCRAFGRGLGFFFFFVPRFFLLGFWPFGSVGLYSHSLGSDLPWDFFPLSFSEVFFSLSIPSLSPACRASNGRSSLPRVVSCPAASVPFFPFPGFFPLPLACPSPPYAFSRRRPPP